MVICLGCNNRHICLGYLLFISLEQCHSTGFKLFKRNRCRCSIFIHRNGNGIS